MRGVAGDDHDAACVAGWMVGADLVVDAGTPYPLSLHGGAREADVRTGVARARKIIAAAQTQGAALVLVSSFTTLPRPGGGWDKLRQAALQGLHRYFDLKRAVELEVQAALRRGLRGCVVNPATCLGPYDLKPRAQTFIPLLAAGEVRVLASDTINAVDVRDVAEIIFAAQAAAFPQAQVPIFGHSLTVAELAAGGCTLTGTRAPALKVPALAGVPALMWMETAYALAGRQTPWMSLPALLVAASYAAPPSPAQQALCPSLRPLNETLRDAVDWYRRIGHMA